MSGLVGALLWRRRAARERVDLYFADGRRVSLDARSRAGALLLPLARAALAAARARASHPAPGAAE